MFEGCKMVSGTDLITFEGKEKRKKREEERIDPREGASLSVR